MKKADPKQMSIFLQSYVFENWKRSFKILLVFNSPYFKENVPWTKDIPKIPKWNEPILFFPYLSVKLTSSGPWKEEGWLSS